MIATRGEYRDREVGSYGGSGKYPGCRSGFVAAIEGLFRDQEVAPTGRSD
jgi:hypothetical protein